MYQKKIIVLLLISGIFLTGCASLFSSGTETNQEEVTGNKGLTIKFEENLPPELVSEGSQNKISFLIKNEGAYNLEGTEENPIEYYLKIGTDLNNRITPRLTDGTNEYETQDECIGQNGGQLNVCSLQVNPHQKTLNKPLIGITQHRTIGGFTQQDFTAEINSTNTQLKKTTRITGTLCFPYETQLKTTVCLDDSLLNPGEEKICQVKMHE